MNVYVQDRDYRDYESITVADTAIGFTASKITPSSGEVANKDAELAFCRLETANVRYRMDGTDPTSSEGVLLKADETVIIVGTSNVKRFRAIRTGSTSGVLKVMFAW